MLFASIYMFKKMGPSPTGGLLVFEALCTFHRKILCADRQYVTQNFDTKQAGRRIFEISVYRPGKFDAHTMTLRQDGGFSAERKMSQLATPQDLLPQDSLRAARNLLHNAHQSKANAICEPISLVKRDRVCAPGLFFAADGPGFSARPPSPQRPLPKRGSESDPGFYSTANGRIEGQLGS